MVDVPATTDVPAMLNATAVLALFFVKAVSGRGRRTPTTLLCVECLQGVTSISLIYIFHSRLSTVRCLLISTPRRVKRSEPRESVRLCLQKTLPHFMLASECLY